MTDDWRPTPSIEALRTRAEVLAAIRSFFADRGVLEVETPLLASATGTDLHLQAMSTLYRGPGHDDGLKLWLQTSPEFAMKRLLAAGSGPIYQLCKAFRDGEAGSRHNPEFTILEWYRPGRDHHQLMAEVAELLDAVLGTREVSSSPDGAPVASVDPVPDPVPDPESSATGIEHPPDGGDQGQGQRSAAGSAAGPATAITGSERITYAEAFQRHVGIDPHTASTVGLAATARSMIGVSVPDLGEDRDGWLELLLSHLVEPKLGHSGATFVYDFPASQAALARIRPGDPPVAERFEAWVEGLELANGYHELVDPGEQRRRFEADLAARREHGLPGVPIDERLLAALAHGMPSCAGVALGVDRLVMLAAGATCIDEVIAFPIDRA